MVSPIATTAIQQTSRTGILGLIGYSFLGIFLILTIGNAIYIATQEKSPVNVVTRIGGDFIFVTQKISELSLNIIDKQGVYQHTDSKLIDIGRFLWTYGLIYIYIYIVYLWIKLLNKLCAWGFTGGMVNISSLILAIFIFITLQSLLILGNAAVLKQVDCFSGCSNSVSNYITKPVMWIYDFYRALPYLVKPANTIINQVPLTNDTSCIGNITCQK